MAKTDDIKRTITFVQTNKKKKFFIKKKKYFSLATKSKNFRFFDEDGYEVYDPVLIGVIFDKWYADYSTNQLLDVMTSLDEEDYALFEEDEIADADIPTTTNFSTGNSEPDTITEHESPEIEEITEDSQPEIEEYVERESYDEEIVEEDTSSGFDDDSGDDD